MDKLSPEALGQKVTDIPKKDSAQWRKNESIIAKNPQLRRMRDIQQGFKPGTGISSGVNDAQYKAGYDQIEWNTDPKQKKSFRVKINGKYQDEEE